MNIGLLNKRIMIQQNEVLTDEIGNHRNDWTDYYACAATVSAEGGAEEAEAGTIVDNSKADFTVRYCAATKFIVPTRYRVVMDDELYEILTVDHLNWRRKAVKLKCRKERR